MTDTYQPDPKVLWPYVTMPTHGRWEVLFVDTKRPYRVALFEDELEANTEAIRLNHLWWLSLKESRELLERVRERAFPRPSSVARASLWTRLKALWPPL